MGWFLDCRYRAASQVLFGLAEDSSVSSCSAGRHNAIPPQSTSCRRACAPNSIPCVRLSVLSTAELTVFVARAWPRYRDHHEIRCTYAANLASCSHAQSRKVRDIHHLHLQLSTSCIGRLMGLLGTQGGLVGNASVCAMRRRGTHVINDPSRDISTHRPTWGPPTVFYLRPHHSLARTMMHDRMPRN